VSSDDEVADDEMERAGVDAEDAACALPRALASACDSAERYEAAEAIAGSDDPERFLNIEGA